MAGPHMKMPSVMHGGHAFSKVPSVSIERSTFDRSHGHKTTFDAGWLIPVFVDEALPGDTFNVQMHAFARLATPYKPIMDNMYLDSFFFAIPYRLVWDNFVKMMGEQTNPGDSTSYVIPKFTAFIPAAGSIYDYMGIPCAPQVTAPITFSCLWARAYNLVFNEWFRDQNILLSTPVATDDGPDSSGFYSLRRRGKRHDYFTSCLPFPQKGTAVLLPLGSTAPVIPKGAATGSVPPFIGQPDAFPAFKDSNAATNSGNLRAVGPAAFSGVQMIPAWTGNQSLRWSDPALQVDLSGATAATINQLRQAFQVQRMLERDARGGTRYTEIVRSHFNVVSPDARLQRPEYLGGGSSPITISPIAQTAPQQAAGVTTPQANLSGIGTVSASGHGFTKSFTEHTLILGLVSVRADLTYQQGINRMFKRSTRFDLFWPSLAHLGEQAVLNEEIFCTGGAGDTTVFGYQERYAEYRYKPSLITGLFRSTHPTPLDVWHLSQVFSSVPTLNQTFIEEDPPIDRVITVQSEPHFLFDSWFRFIAARPMPVFGVPGLIDHF